ncbi:hypothetical protein VIGAN_02147500, partial [Vigna angularis var. angularis]
FLPPTQRQHSTMACNRRLPPSPLGRNSSLPQPHHREENRHKREEKPSEVKIENPEKARGTDGGVNKRKTIRRPRSKRPYLLQTKPWQEKMKVLKAAAACVYINKQTPEKNSCVLLLDVQMRRTLKQIVTTLEFIFWQKLPLELVWGWKKRRNMV